MKKFFLLALMSLFILSCDRTIIDPEPAYIYEYFNNTSYDIEVVVWRGGETAEESVYIIPKGNSLTHDANEPKTFFYSDSLMVKLDTIATSQVYYPKCFKCSYCYDDRLNLYYLANYEETETDEWVFFCKYTFTDEDFENINNVVKTH